MSYQSQKITHEILLKADEEFNKIKDGKLATKLRAIMAFEDNSAEHIAQIFKVSIRTVFRWINKFIEHGVEGLKDQPKGHYRPKLTEYQRKQIKSWIVEGVNSEGTKINWTLNKLRLEIDKVFLVQMTTTALWKNLRKAGMTLKRPRPVHYKANKEEQALFKKNSKRN